jgi:NAD(P)-dependent dehydrogenase (short-subunit alcohol dehydrogenase family)
MLSLRQKVVIVTGGTGALGRVVAASFQEAGAHVAIPSHSTPAPGVSPHHAPESPAFIVRADVAKESDVQSFCKAVVERFGTIDILLNIAGGYAGGNSIENTTLEQWQGMFNLNLTTAFLMSRQVIPVMRAKKFGRIVNIAARPAIHPAAKSGPYAVAKRGVITLTEILADETKGSGITVNAIAPNIIDTPGNAASMPNADRSRWVSPKEIAALILGLCGDDAGSISGNTIKIFGN